MIKINCGCGRYPLAGFVNLDKKKGWVAQDGLKDFEDFSISGITISHMLIYLSHRETYDFFKECYRVLGQGGIIRITEDNTTSPESEIFGGWRDFITLTDPKIMIILLEKAGFTARECAPDETLFIDKSLIQQFHGSPPRVFHVEGAK